MNTSAHSTPLSHYAASARGEWPRRAGDGSLRRGHHRAKPTQLMAGIAVALLMWLFAIGSSLAQGHADGRSLAMAALLTLLLVPLSQLARSASAQYRR